MRTRNCGMRLFYIAFIIFFEICAICPAAALSNDDDTSLTPSEQCAAACSTTCNPRNSGCLRANPSPSYSSEECTCTCAMTGCDITKQDPRGTSKTISVTCAVTSTSPSEVSCRSNDTACSMGCIDQCQFLMYHQDCKTENSLASITDNVCACNCQLHKCRAKDGQNITVTSSCTVGDVDTNPDGTNVTGTNCTFSF